MQKNLSRTERYLRVCKGMIERLVTRCGNGERLVTASSCLVHSCMRSAGFHFLPRQVNAAPSWFSDRSVHVCPYLATFCVAVQVVPWMFKNRVRIYEYKKIICVRTLSLGPVSVRTQPVLLWFSQQKAMARRSSKRHRQ